MPQFDRRGCAISGASDAALALYERAFSSLWLQRGDALGLARQASSEAPGFVAAHQLEAGLLLSSRDVRDFRSAARVLERVQGLPRNAREQRHDAAITAAAGGDFAGASRIYDEVLREEPRDVAALHVAQVFDYYLGNPSALCARPARVLRHWVSVLPGYHAVLSMHAFGLEECGEYAAAEQAARRALEIEPLDVRAHHVVAHVLEMQGRAVEGLRWMGSRSAQWTGAGAAATHLWWHLALYHQQLGRPDLALAVYDRRMHGEGLSRLIDASALLWRLHLAGSQLEARFEALAERWAPYAEDAYCAFNDLHAMMAFVGARRWKLAERLLAAQARRVAASWSANLDMTRLVGLPACRALAAFGHGDFGTAEGLLRALPPVAHRIGGSHAQRDVLLLTRAAAARRGGHLLAA
jgi:tetratricopeptide (TPR) repeat protein